MCDTSITKVKCHGVAPRRGESAPLGTEAVTVPTQGAGAGGVAGGGRRVPPLRAADLGLAAHLRGEGVSRGGTEDPALIPIEFSQWP